MKNLSGRILPIFMLVSSLVLLYVGVPRFLAELMLVPGTPIYERTNLGEPVTDEELEVLRESRIQAISFVDHPKAYNELGQVHILRAQRASTDEERIAEARKAIEYLETSISLAPVNTFAWARIVSASLMIGPETYPKAVEAWRTSVALARFEPFILITRVHMGIALYSEMSNEDRAILREQVDLTYNWNRGQLRQYARRNNLVDWIAILLFEYPEKAAWIRS